MQHSTDLPLVSKMGKRIRPRKMTIGELVRAARESAGLLQSELSIKAGLSPSAVAQWERPNSTKDPSLRSLEKVCKALGITMQELFGGADVGSQKMERELLTLFRQLSLDEQAAYLTILRSRAR